MKEEIAASRQIILHAAFLKQNGCVRADERSEQEEPATTSADDEASKKHATEQQKQLSKQVCTFGTPNQSFAAAYRTHHCVWSDCCLSTLLCKSAWRAVACSHHVMQFCIQIESWQVQLNAREPSAV